MILITQKKGERQVLLMNFDQKDTPVYWKVFWFGLKKIAPILDRG